MDPSLWLLILFLALSAFFSGCESAFLSVNLLKLQTLAKTDRRAQSVLDLREITDKLIIVMLIGTNVANIAATAMVTSIATTAFGSAGVGYATGAMTLLILIFGEILPKNIAIAFAQPIALGTARIFKVLCFILRPAIAIFSFLSTFVLKLMGKEGDEKVYSRDDLRTLVEVGVQENQVELGDKQKIEGVLRFSELNSSDVMTPRTKINMLPGNMTLSDTYEIIRGFGHSRVPVYGEDKDEILGIAYLRDFLEAYISMDRETPIKRIVREAAYVSEYEYLDDVFELFKDKRTHIAIVQDEYGGTAGLITMEDLIEEITGEIYDETDTDRDISLRLSKDGSLIVDGETEIEKVSEMLGIEIDRSDDYNTIAGYVQSQSEEIINETGHEEIIENLRVKILEVDGSILKRMQLQVQKTESLGSE